VFCKGVPLFLCIVFVASAAASAAEIRFIPMLSIKEAYNDNVFFEDTYQQKTNDSVTTISPGLRITGRTEQVDSSLQTMLNVLRYHDQHDLDTTDSDNRSYLGYKFSERWDASLDARYTSDSRIDRDIENTGLVVGTARRKKQVYGVTTSYLCTEKGLLDFSYEYGKEDYNDQEFSDSTYQNIGLGFGYNLDSILSQSMARLDLVYALYSFTDTDVVSSAITIGASRKLNEQVNLSADAGSSFTRSSFEEENVSFGVEDQGSERGAIGGVQLSYRDDYTSAKLSARKEIKGLSGSPGTVRATTYSFTLTHMFTRKFKSDMSAEYYINRANRGQLAGEDIDEDTLNIRPRLIYSFNDYLTLEAAYRFVRLRDHIEDLETKQKIASLSLVWQYPIPR